MASTFSPTAPGEADEVASFLKRILAPAGACPGFESAGLHWKYWSPREDWTGARSYVLRGPGGIEAHCGVLPVRFESAQGVIQAAHFIDWAADPRTFATGTRILRKLAPLVESLYAVGGSATTRKMLPVLGFRGVNEAVFLARPVRAFRQAVTHPQRDWKLPARFMRNLWWSRTPAIKIPAGWSFESVRPEQVPEHVWSTPLTTWATRARLPSLYAHYLACPWMRFELFLVRRQSEAVGCFLIGFVLGQARIVDVWLTEHTAERYGAAYRLALVAALTDPDTVEVITAAAIPLRLEAVQQCGLREYRREVIMFPRSDRVLPETFDFQFIDNDMAFLSFGTRDYMT